MKNTEELTIETILNNEVYKKILADSFGGIMYQEGTQASYKADELLKLWDELPEADKEASGGITQGVFNFLKD